MPRSSGTIKKCALLLSLSWTTVVLCSFACFYSQQKSNVIEISKSEARIAFQKDILYRKWASKHGGVYVPATQETPPNPYIPSTIERDISTPSGKSLTLMNPAYMTRQVYELAAEGNNYVRGHLTSLNPIRKENAPDQWERVALSTFERGSKEACEIQLIDGHQYMRLMRPFITEQTCLKCHATQGYKIGDIRGGISVLVPISAFSVYSERIIAGTGASHVLIWLLGIGMIGLGSQKLSKDAATLNDKNRQLSVEISERQMTQEALQKQAVMLEEKIAERKLAEEELQKKNTEIEQFIYTLSHDLRSPLVTVKTFMGYLEKDMDGDDKKQISEDMKFIHNAADKMKLLLDELMELSRIGRVETPPVRVSLMELVSEALDTLAGVIRERKVDIHLPDTDLMLLGDRPRLNQIWQNLIENAIRYSLDDKSPCIELGVRQMSGEQIFYVKDNGIGIDPNYHSKIFGIFEKLDPKSPGAGLGLSMVQRIVDKCGGRIWVESAGSDKGSCFCFTLPNAVVQS